MVDILLEVLSLIMACMLLCGTFLLCVLYVINVACVVVVIGEIIVCSGEPGDYHLQYLANTIPQFIHHLTPRCGD
jgi:hypothetical protein